MNGWLQRAPLLVVVLVLLLAGAAEYVRADEDRAGTALIAAGLIVLGAWLSLEAVAIHQRMHDHDHDEEGGGDGPAQGDP